VNDPRKTLLQQIAALRKTIDPKVLNRAKLAAEGKEPYDKEAARAAVNSFLTEKNRQDGGAFQRKLMAALKTGGGTTPPPPAPPTPKRRIGRL
jgi:hypothetical protein